MFADNSKRIALVTALMGAFALTFNGSFARSPIFDRQDKNDKAATEPQSPAPQTVLKGGVTFCVPRGTGLKLKIASVPTHGLKLLDRDLEGNLLPAKTGQKITAKISEDIYVDDNKVIPEGTIFHGKVVKILPPRRFYRQGSLEINFTQFDLPDGRKFSFTARADNFKESTWKSKARGFGRIAARTAGGALVGALVAYQLSGGMENTIAMHGYNVAGGAAVGALLATGYACMEKGPKATLEPGDDLNLSIDADLLLPAAVEPTVKKRTQDETPGLNIEIEKSKLVKDGLGGHLLRLDVNISNETNKRFKSIDLFLEDSNGNRQSLVGGPDDMEASETLFTVEPGTDQRIRLWFPVEWPKLKRSLVWVDHQKRTICSRTPLPL